MPDVIYGRSLITIDIFFKGRHWRDRVGRDGPEPDPEPERPRLHRLRFQPVSGKSQGVHEK